MSQGRVIGMISGKGGVGKTSLTVNLGVSLKQFGNEVTLIDADFSASNLGVHLGRYDHPIKLQHVLKGDAEPEHAVFRHPTGLKAMVSSNEINQVEPDVSELPEAIQHAKETSDYVIVDCPPGLNTTVEQVMSACDELMVVTLPTQSSGINAAQIVEKAKQMRKPVLGTVINMSENKPDSELIDREVEMMTESHVMTEIPHDPKVKESLFENRPFVQEAPLAPASLQVKELAASIDGQQYEKPKFAKFKRNINKIRDTLQS